MNTYPNQPGNKTGGTSLEAAESMIGQAATLRRAVMGLLYQQPYIFDGLTADEAAARLGRSVLSIRPRFTELLAAGLIRDSGRVRKNASGRNATVWLCTLNADQPKLI